MKVFFYRKVGKKSCDTVLLKGQSKEIFSFPIFYSIIFLNYYNVHYVNVVYTSENIGTQISVLNRDIWAKICTKIEAKTTLH